MKLSQLLFSFLMGYFCYSLVEIVLRGYTHWTMCLTGGFAMAILYAINSRRTMTLIRSCALGTLLITAIELTVGIFDNIIMHWNVWDYSDLWDRYAYPFRHSGSCCVSLQGLSAS